MTDTREQLLISRAVDGDATENEWTEFESFAATRPQLWRDLAQAQRDQSALLRAVGHAGDAAQNIDLRRLARTTMNQHDPPLRLNRLGAWTGWVVAALVTLVATVQFRNDASGPDSASTPAIGAQEAGIGSFLSSSDAFQAYLQKGRESGEVIGEMPTKVLLDTRAAPSGTGYEVVYLRQVMERVIVPDLYQVRGQNERGQPMLTRYARPSHSSM